MINETDVSRKFRNLISTSQLVKRIAQHGYEGEYTEQAVYILLNKYGIKPKTTRGSKPYFNRINAVNCVERHIFELRNIAEVLKKQNEVNNDEDLENEIGYNRNDMSNISRECLANDCVFGADENELYRTDESRKIIRISEDKLRLFRVKKNIKINEKQFYDLFEGVDIKPGNNKTINFSINQDRTDIGNNSYADTRFFGRRGDIANGDGTIARGYNGINDEYESTKGMVDLYKSAIRIIQHRWYKNVDALLDNINAPKISKTTVKRIIFDKSINDEKKINVFNDSLIRSLNKLNVLQGKYDRVNSVVRTNKPGRPAKIKDNAVLPRYNVGLVPNTNVKLIALFEISDFNFSDAIKHGNMRSNKGTEKIVGDTGKINKLGRGAQERQRVNVSYDNDISPVISNNFSLTNVSDGHFKQQYGYEDKNYTSVAQFMDKSIMGAAYAIKKENIQVDYILDAPSSSKFNHYYCTNLSRKLGVEYRSGFFQRNMLNVSIDEEAMRKNGINDRIIDNTKVKIRSAAIAEITSYMNECVARFIDENFAYLSNISSQKMSREKVDKSILIGVIREQSYNGLINIKKENPKTSNLYMYLVNHFADYKVNINSKKFNTEHISNEISKVLRTKLSRKYQVLLSEIDKITSTYEQILLTNGMKLSSSKKFKLTDIDEHVRPYLKNAYVVADSEMAFNKNGMIDKLRSSLIGKHFLIVDEDIDSGATLYLLINALKDKQLECGLMKRSPGRPKIEYINDSQIACLVNAIKK